MVLVLYKIPFYYRIHVLMFIQAPLLIMLPFLSTIFASEDTAYLITVIILVLISLATGTTQSSISG